MKKILIQYNYILHYRKAFFNELAKYYDVTVLHSGKKSVTKDDLYKEIVVPVRKIGPFYFQGNVISEVKKECYDIHIALFDVRWINTVISIYFKSKNSKFIWWGAWITKSFVANKIRLFFTKKADANVFYTYEAKKDFINLGVLDSNLFVANNTFDVGVRIKSYENTNKNRILFVGSLDKRKQNYVLINAFCNILSKIPNNIILTFVGDGVERSFLHTLVKEKGLDSRVEFAGRINEPEKLQEYYKESIVAVSFGQAGLSVLQSLGFGVPFVTKINAISGGEKSNIKDKINGIFCQDNQNSLEEVLVKMCNSIELAREMGKKAYEYYGEYCTIENMVQGFRDAIEGTKLAKVDTGIYEG
ncbi:glycosyltransferase family 4 protein [Campylobacter sp. RM9344]|uniref:Glycosyltransferase family 4 protein n=2 Tax=Campylobacter californiensis TaxID=1032243 RepID=A0AAW3ZT40_9BACT|nr:MULTISPECIES: glycosyltransferase family 4 protein [unclassified Campylobacter]MBE2983879.1 glycosyltransferase family 4 protein [Campylobacter sp. RM6883]MBE2994417.1 glycosyltransferase family 4 protein [Campylobacter sp. RM6913]MBE3028725.1 glycosyltransferase family 4 protein [Campylobacter sp. RM9344]MBE3607614.1 glycosyltransferase family 4 protein [Campylobacter sp. RM9337]QCD51005.1 glycosyltransferase, family 1 [Campylobacter sp. RM6914]